MAFTLIELNNFIEALSAVLFFMAAYHSCRLKASFDKAFNNAWTIMSIGFVALAVRRILGFITPSVSVNTAYTLKYGVFPFFLIGVPLIFLYGFYKLSEAFNHTAHTPSGKKK